MHIARGAAKLSDFYFQIYFIIHHGCGSTIISSKLVILLHILAKWRLIVIEAVFDFPKYGDIELKF